MPDEKKIGPKPPPRPPVAKQPAPPPRPPVAKQPAPPPRPPVAKQPAPPPRPPLQKAVVPPPVKVVPGVRPVVKPAAERLMEKEARQQQRRAYRNIGAAAVGTAVAGTVVAGTAAGVAAQTVAPEQLDQLAQRLAALQQAAALVDIHADLEDVDSALAVLPSDLAALRNRGYVFAGDLEQKIEALAAQWSEARSRVMDEAQRRSQMLEQDVNDAQNALQMAYTGGPAAVSRAQTAIQMLESKVAANQDALEGMFNTIDQNVTQIQQQLEAISWALDQADQASFGFHPDEKLVSACEAQLLDDRSEPKGVLFLTDGRLIFERKEDVATKKVLFITTAKETVQELAFEVPIGYVEEVKASEAGGLFSRQEKLEFRFSHDSPITHAVLRLIGADNEQWNALIGRVRSGEIDKERVQPAAPVSAEAAATPDAAPQEVPTKCPNCGALLTTPIVRGMREINCAYCGTIIRL